MSIRRWISISAGLLFVAVGARGNDRHHSMNISGRHDGPATSCSDLHIQFDGRDAQMRSEERTLSKAEAPLLQVLSHENGGVQVTGWDKDNYSVTICKAASGSKDEAEKIFSQISVSTEGGMISTKGPSGDHDWTIYLLIRTPKASSIDLQVKNGPLEMYEVNGKLKVHAQNGPIELRDFSGDAEINAQNGPVDVEGSGGNIQLHAQNGPISISLKGKSWNGTGLSADAENGPVSLSVPQDYQSSFLVESRGYTPISCKASICGSAQKTWDDDHKRIEYGSAPAVIKLSTVNGPVSVD